MDEQRLTEIESGPSSPGTGVSHTRSIKSLPSAAPYVAHAFRRSPSVKAKRRYRPRPPRGVPGLIERVTQIIDSFGSTSAAAVAIARSEGALRKWVRGKSEPSASDIRRLCEASGYSAEWFLFGMDLQGRCERENRTPVGPSRLVPVEEQDARDSTRSVDEDNSQQGDDFMRHQRAREILLNLLKGIDPLTNEELPRGTVLEKPDVVRALFEGAGALEQTLARESRRSQLPKNIGKTWSDEEDRKLRASFEAREPTADIAARHGRTVRAIEARLEKLGLMTAEQRTTVDRFGSAAKDSDSNVE
jgi:hypothetical protein